MLYLGSRAFFCDIMKQFSKEPKTFAAGPLGSIIWRFLLFFPLTVITCGRMHKTAVHRQAPVPKQMHPWQLTKPRNRSGSPQPGPISDSLEFTVITPLFFQGCFYYLNVHLEHYSILLSVFELYIHGSLSIFAWCIFLSVFVLIPQSSLQLSLIFFATVCISLCDCAKVRLSQSVDLVHFQFQPIL